MTDWLESKPGAVMVHLRVQPGAKKNEIVVEETRVRVRLQAPPVEGKANAALLKFLASRLGVRRAALVLVRGDKNREKTVAIRGLTPAEVEQKIRQ